MITFSSVKFESHEKSEGDREGIEGRNSESTSVEMMNHILRNSDCKGIIFKCSVHFLWIQWNKLIIMKGWINI